MTLLEDLETCAKDDDVFADVGVSLLGTAGEPSVSRERAKRLRRYADTLREEYELFRRNIGVSALLDRINGGPL